MPLTELLFSGFTSGLLDVVEMLLMSVVPAAAGNTLTTIEKVALLPLVSVAMLQLTVPPGVPTIGTEQVNVGPVFC